MAKEVLGQSAVAKLKTMLLSNNTIPRRIQEKSDDIQQQTTACIKASDYEARQIDESTDVANSAI